MKDSFHVILVEDFAVDGGIVSRDTGLRIRKRIEECLERGEKIVLDFGNVGLITQGVVDEILGVLIRERGFDVVRKNLKFRNCNSLVKHIIGFVVHYSSESCNIEEEVDSVERGVER